VDQFFALFPVFDAAAQVLADGFWQPGDFSDASGAHILGPLYSNVTHIVKVKKLGQG
jgi:hypothetical protein